jgi:ParB family chromosome partitioning protein|tara:strand:+ start:1886 stop:2770 length:885 start_codon:yes stop_codon:yes gene_type:complete
MSFKNFNLSEKIAQSEHELGVSINKDEILSVSPDSIDNWEYRDRSENELGSIEDLIDSIKTNGQVQPIIITEASDIFKPKNKSLADVKYVVIAGYRRWLACKKACIDVKCVVRKVTLPEAVGILLSENEKVDVSDASKGFLYSKLIADKKINQNELSERLGINKNKLSNYLAFQAFPEEFITKAEDLSNISARTAGYLRSLFKKDQDHVDALIKNARKISKGMGERSISQLVENEINPKKKPDSLIYIKNKHSKLIVSADGTLTVKSKNYESDEYMSFLQDVEDIYKERFCIDD